MACFKRFKVRVPSEGRWCLVFKSHVRPSLVVVHAPGFHDGLGLFQGCEPVGVEAFIAQRSVERLDEAVVRRLAWPAEIDLGVVA